MRKMAVGRPLKSMPSSEETTDKPASAAALLTAAFRVLTGLAGMVLLSC
jgi:hypothetical protein